MENPNKQNDDRNELFNLLSSLNSSGVGFTNYREIAAWAITVLYLTALSGVTKYVLEIPINNCPIFILIMLSILLITFIVVVFVHSQYGAHVSNRTLHSVLTKFMFKAISGEILIKDILFSDETVIFPKFIKDEYEKKSKNEHSIKKIGPWIIYVWIIKKIHELKKEKICSSIPEYSKFNLLESSLYNLILVPMIISIILITYHFCQ